MDPLTKRKPAAVLLAGFAKEEKAAMQLLLQLAALIEKAATQLAIAEAFGSRNPHLAETSESWHALASPV